MGFWPCSGLWQADLIGILDRAVCDATAWWLCPYLLMSWLPLSGPLLTSEQTSERQGGRF